MSMSKKIIAVIGASGNQGGSVVRALRASGQFHVRALTRNPGKHRELGDEVVEADLSRPETLRIAFEGAYGVFVVTNFWEPGTDEWAQGMAAVNAAKAAGVEHFIWSTLPNVEMISCGAFDVPHFTYKARVDELVRQAGFAHHTFVVAPFFYQNLNGMLAAQSRPDGSAVWTLPIDPTVKAMHMGDITELGAVVAGAFSNPAAAGNGQFLPLVGDHLSFDDIVNTLQRQGHKVAFNQVPASVFSTFFDGAAELAQMFAYFEKHTYLGANHERQIRLAAEIAGKPATDFATWAKTSFSMPAAAKATDNADTQAIRQQLQRYEKALNASDAEAVMELYTIDAVFMPQHAPALVGRAAVRAGYEQVFATIKLDVRFDIHEIEEAGEWAWARTSSSGRTKILAAGVEVTEGNNELFIFRRENGSWKIHRYLFSTNQPRA